MTTLRAVDRSACAELALAPGTEFEGLFRFLPAGDQDFLLSLEAMFRSLRDVPLAVSDPSVGMAKLGWWQQELARAPVEGSQHPVVRALLESGALDALDPDTFGDYLHALVTDLQADPVMDGAALRERLMRTAGAEARMLAGQGRLSAARLEVTGAAARLLELMRTLGGPGGAHAWLPMDLVAKHQVREAAKPTPEQRAPVIADLAALAQAWRSEANLKADIAHTPGERQLVLRDVLVARRLRQAEAQPERWLSRGGRGGVGDVFSAWRVARRLAHAMERDPGAGR